MATKTEYSGAIQVKDTDLNFRLFHALTYAKEAEIGYNAKNLEFSFLARDVMRGKELSEKEAEKFFQIKDDLDYYLYVYSEAKLIANYDMAWYDRSQSVKAGFPPLVMATFKETINPQ